MAEAGAGASDKILATSEGWASGVASGMTGTIANLSGGAIVE
jgi:hypothetical protein